MAKVPEPVLTFNFTLSQAESIAAAINREIVDPSAMEKIDEGIVKIKKETVAEAKRKELLEKQRRLREELAKIQEELPETAISAAQVVASGGGGGAWKPPAPQAPTIQDPFDFLALLITCNVLQSPDEKIDVIKKSVGEHEIPNDNALMYISEAFSLLRISYCLLMLAKRNVGPLKPFIDDLVVLLENTCTMDFGKTDDEAYKCGCNNKFCKRRPHYRDQRQAFVKDCDWWLGNKKNKHGETMPCTAESCSFSHPSKMMLNAYLIYCGFNNGKIPAEVLYLFEFVAKKLNIPKEIILSISQEVKAMQVESSTAVATAAAAAEPEPFVEKNERPRDGWYAKKTKGGKRVN